MFEKYYRHKIGVEAPSPPEGEGWGGGKRGFMTETIHIALTFDDNYTEHSVVLMTSILANKKVDENIHFHLLDSGFSDFAKAKITEVKNCVIEFHKVDIEIFKNYKKADYYPVSMLFTMILPDIIDTDRLIYLDSDMIVNTSLNELWNIDFEGNYIAGVEDANGKKYAKRFGLKKGSRFFNTGTMLLNCAKWREDDISKRAVEISMANTGTRFGYDQTVLNQLFEDKVKFVDLKWNLQYCPINVWATYEDREEYKRAIENPRIVHYVGDYKPWKQGLGCFNPRQENYLKYHKMTSYAFADYVKWQMKDKLTAYKGLIAFIKRYPFFFLKKQFWKNLI